MAELGDLMASVMRRDIFRQPDCLQSLGRRAADFLQIGENHARPGEGGRVFVCGCGDGFFAAIAAQSFARQKGLRWHPLGSLEMVLAAGTLTPADRVIAISMSGNVDRTVEAALAAKSAGVELVALVNSRDGGRLGQIASAMISLDIPDVAPFLCGTATYTATILALMLLICGSAGDQQDVELIEVLDAQRVALEATDAVIGSLNVPSGVRILSASAEMGTAAYGAAKFVELTLIPAWSAELEEFAHSQYWSMPRTDLVVMIAAEPLLAAYADEACAALSELGVTTLAVDTPASPIQNATHRITLPIGTAALAPLVTALPLQMLAYQMANLSGLNPDTREHLKQDETRFRVSRRLTRRTLLGTGL